MVDTKKYVFDDTTDLVNYLFSEFGNLTPLKLQKGLYFLYAYYGAIFNVEQTEGVVEETFNMPEELFPASFEAWTYGPVMRDVYINYKEGVYSSSNINLELIKEINDEFPKAIEFIRDMFGQINTLSDFTLVDRSHEDRTWIEAYKEGKSTKIDNNDLIKEYREKYVR